MDRASGHWRQWWRRLSRPVRRAVFGYAVITVFAAAYFIARAIDSGLSLAAALVPASLVAAPLLVAVIGDRITGLKFMSVEVSLSQVQVHVDDRLSIAVQELADMGPSVMPQIADRIISSIEHPDRDPLLRVNLGDGTAWWSTRLFMLSALASDYTNIQQLVFVDEGDRRHFIGFAEPWRVHRSLAEWFPACETAYRRLRSSVVTPVPPAAPAEEVQGILNQWPFEFPAGEVAAKEFTTRDFLRTWLYDCLEPNYVEWDGGPISPLLRFQINAQSSRYVALTSGGDLRAVVDRDLLARGAEQEMLRAKLR